MLKILKYDFLKNLVYFNIISIPTLLISGPFFSDLIVSLNAVIFLYITIKTKDFKFFNFKVIQIIFIVWIVFIISSLLSENKLWSLKSSLFYFRFFLFAGSIYLVRKKLLIINNLNFLAFIIPIMVISIDVIFQSFFGFNVIGLESWDPSRNSSFFGDEHISGSYIVRTLPISLLYLFWFIKNKNNNKIFYLLFLFLFFCTLATFLSGERTAFFLILLFNIYFLFCFSRLKISRLYFLLITIFSIIFILSISKSTYNRIIVDTLNDTGITHLINDLKSDNDISLSVDKFLKRENRYLSHYHSAILMYQDNKVFGIGPKNFRKLCAKEKYILNSLSCANHPHSTWIQILTETGIIPFTILIIFFSILVLNTLKFIFYNIKGKKNMIDDEKVIIYGAFLITLWPLIPSGNFFNNWLSIVYFFPLGFYLILKEK